MPISEELMKILVCPTCKGEVVEDGESCAIVCASCNVKYPVMDGIPVMLEDEAQSADLP